MNHTKSNQQGFSLLEVMIFILLLNIIFVAATSFVIASLYRMKINEHRIRAVFYAEELKEWLSAEREADWAGLQTRASAAGMRYCVNGQLNLNATFATMPLFNGTCQFNGIGNSPPLIFRRSMTLTQTTPTQVAATVLVEWTEARPGGGTQLYSETIQALYTAW